MKNEKLRPLSKMMWPSYATIFKGVKIQQGGIHLKKTYHNVKLEPSDIQNYLKVLDWDCNQPPLTVLYLLAQRAQIALVLNKKFTIAIPGLMHIGNKLSQLHTISFDMPFTLEVSMDVDYKKEGSLIPICKVNYIQNNKIVAVCESLYIAKRKTKSKLKKKENEELTDVLVTEKWDIYPNIAKKYAKASDDRNPIHTSKIFAKFFGLKKCILHGWYCASRIVKSIENKHQLTFKTIEVNFKVPVFLPSTQRLESSSIINDDIHFLLRDDKNDRITLSGILKK